MGDLSGKETHIYQMQFKNPAVSKYAAKRQPITEHLIFTYSSNEIR